MVATYVDSASASSTLVQTCGVDIPATAQDGDLLIAGFVYGDDTGSETIATWPTGWTLFETDRPLNSPTGSCQVSIAWTYKTATTARPEFGLGAAGTDGYNKAAVVVGVYRGSGDPVFGTPEDRSSATASTVTVAPSVDALTGDVVAGLWFDKVSSQTGVTGPAEQTTRQSLVMGGGGSVSALLTDETRAADGATGTRTATYDVASILGYGVLVVLPATGGTFDPPANLTATPISASEIDLSWDAVPTATGYDIERDGTVIVSDHALTTYSDTGLNPSTTYSYRVRAVQ